MLSFSRCLSSNIYSRVAEKTVAEATECEHMWARQCKEKQEFWQQKTSKALLAEASEKADFFHTRL